MESPEANQPLPDNNWIESRLRHLGRALINRFGATSHVPAKEGLDEIIDTCFQSLEDGETGLFPTCHALIMEFHAGCDNDDVKTIIENEWINHLPTAKAA